MHQVNSMGKSGDICAQASIASSCLSQHLQCDAVNAAVLTSERWHMPKSVLHVNFHRRAVDHLWTNSGLVTHTMTASSSPARQPCCKCNGSCSQALDRSAEAACQDKAGPWANQNIVNLFYILVTSSYFIVISLFHIVNSVITLLLSIITSVNYML